MLVLYYIVCRSYNVSKDLEKALCVEYRKKKTKLDKQWVWVEWSVPRQIWRTIKYSKFFFSVFKKKNFLPASLRYESDWFNWLRFEGVGVGIGVGVVVRKSFCHHHRCHKAYQKDPRRNFYWFGCDE